MDEVEPWAARIGIREEFSRLTVAEFQEELEAWWWREDREMERAAWLAWHFLIPWQKKGSKLKPSDLLPDKEKASGNRPRLAQSPADRKRDLEHLKREMGVEE